VKNVDLLCSTVLNTANSSIYLFNPWYPKFFQIWSFTLVILWVSFKWHKFVKYCRHLHIDSLHLPVNTDCSTNLVCQEYSNILNPFSAHCRFSFPLPYLLACLLTHSLTLWCRILFAKLIVIQLIKKYPASFMEPEGSSPCSQKSATGLYPEPAESNSLHQSLSPKV
jgi:hypothetical protein